MSSYNSILLYICLRNSMIEMNVNFYSKIQAHFFVLKFLRKKWFLTFPMLILSYTFTT